MTILIAKLQTMAMTNSLIIKISVSRTTDVLMTVIATIVKTVIAKTTISRTTNAMQMSVMTLKIKAIMQPLNKLVLSVSRTVNAAHVAS